MSPTRLSLILLLALPAWAGAAPVVLHVSPDGLDTNAGTSEKPLRTPAAARNAVRKLRAGGAEPVTVLLHKGTYYLDQPLAFTPDDSGSAQKPVVYAGAPGEEVILSGGSRLNLVWEDHQNGIKKAKVSPELVTDQLFVNGERQPLARYPNFDAKAKYFNGSAPDAVAKERVKRWADPKGGWLHAMHKHEWGGFHYVITGKNPQGDVTLDGGWQNNRRMGMHDSIRFVENIFEELDAPGEWFLDSKTSTLYFYPPKGLDLNKAVVEAARLRHLIEFKGSADKPVRGVTIKNVTFRHTTRTFMDNREPLLRSDWTIYRGGAVFLTGCEDCALEDCRVHQVGGDAVFVNIYNRRVAVRGCSITEAGGNGVAFVGDPKAVRSPLFEYDEKQDVKLLDMTAGPKTNNYPAECVVEDCLITRTGRVEKQSAPVQISMAQGITVRHCSIYDVPRAGINISEGTWGGHLVEFCDVFDTVQETGDHGSFNSWGRDRYWVPSIDEVDARVAAHPALPELDAVKPIVLRNNRWRCDHGWDIDLDDGSSNYHIYNNLCLNGGLKLREGYRRTVENNVLVNNSFHPHVWYAGSGDVFARNVVGTEFKPIQMPKAWGKTVDSNLFPDRAALGKAQALGTDANSQAGDPLFVYPAGGDYRVKDGSPALKLGFKNFPMDRFGVTSPRLRAVARTPKLPGAGEGEAKTALRNERAFSWHGAELKNVVGRGEVSAAGLPGETGVLLVAVPAESGAGKAGLKKGDVIVKFDGKPVADAGDLLGQDCAASRGAVKLGVWRDQKDATVVIELGPKTVLRAAKAELTGDGQRPVYDAKKDYLGSWSNPNAQVSWKTTAPESATYSVQILFACQPSSAGSEFELVIGGKTLKGTVPKTGSWDDFSLEVIGRVELKKGNNLNVSLRPASKPMPAVMNLRAVILEPVP